MAYPDKLTPEWLAERIADVQYHVVPNTTTTVCSIILDNGFVVTKTSSCINPDNFDAEFGKEAAYEECLDALWELYGFVIKEHDYQNPDDGSQYFEDFSFGKAIEHLKAGKRVARSGWNGKDMFLYYVPASKYPAQRNTNSIMVGVFPDDMVPYGAYIAMKTAQGNVVPWLASQSDMLAEDWHLV